MDLVGLNPVRLCLEGAAVNRHQAPRRQRRPLTGGVSLGGRVFVEHASLGQFPDQIADGSAIF